MSDSVLAGRYGPWALIAGASEGIGEHFARQLAARGLHLILVARRADVLQGLADELASVNGVEVRTLALDLASPDATQQIRAATADLEVGMLVYNAAVSVVGSFLDHTIEEYRAEQEVNCRRPLELAHHFAAGMGARGRGAILLMSSLAGSQGSPFIAHYGATKAWNLVFAEGLWGELAEQGIDVLACRAGATRTPKYLRSAGNGKRSGFVPEMESAAVVEEALAALGQRPSMVPGRANRLAAGLLQRLLPRRMAVSVMGRASRSAGVGPA
jgi:short-subunit dehydrogenase